MIIPGPLTDGDDAPFRPDAVIENYYRDVADNFAFEVAAGAAKGDPQQGFVGVATYNHPIGFGQGAQGMRAINKTTPPKHGSVHITRVDGPVVTLVAKDGAVFSFDFQTYTMT
jgi:hypothetical protein